MFEQSIDWSDQIGASLWWMTWVFTLTAAVSLAAVAALLRFTTWGRQFWRVSGDYFKGRASLPVWGLLALLLLSVVAFFGDPRFKVPALPFVAVGAGIVADRLLARRTAPADPTPPPPRGTPLPR